jgi:hypothetical protein
VPKESTDVSVSEVSWTVCDEEGKRAVLLTVLFGSAALAQDEDAPSD